MPLADRVGASWRGRSVGRMAGQWQTGCRQAGNRRARNWARAPLHWASQGQRWGRCKVRRRAERVSRPGQGEEPSPERLGGHHLLAQTEPRCPAGQVMRHHLHRQPGGVGGEAARGEMIQPHAVLEVSDGILDLGVAAMVGLQCQGFPLPVGDEAVISVAGEEGQLGTGRGLHPPADGDGETMSRTGAASGSFWKGVYSLSHKAACLVSCCAGQTDLDAC